MQNNNNNSPIIKDKEGKNIEVPVEGSIGLLALGYKGLMAWRMKRKEVGDSLNQKENEQKK